MEVKKGYKQTDVGVIPEDWEVKTIFQVAPLQRGFDLPTSQVKHGPFPVVYSNGIEKFHVVAKVSGPGVVTGRSGTLGKVHYIENDYWPHNTSLWVTHFKENFPRFVYYLYQQINFERFASGSGVPTLNRNDAHIFRIALPSEVKEQRAIAEALGDVDALLGALEKLIAKKRALKQAAMQELLTGKKRLPGFESKAGYKQTEVGVIPEDWGVYQFANIADKHVPWSITGGPFGSSLKTCDYTSEGIRIIQLQNIGDGYFCDDYAIYTSTKKADELLSNNIYSGEIILSKMGDPVARACIVPGNKRRYLMASDGIRLVVDSKRFNKYFVHEYINSEYFRKNAQNASTGSTRQRIGLSELKQLPLAAPPLLEQTAIATVLSDMDTEIEALEKRLEKTRVLKQGMMQELLTGRTKLIN